LVSSHMFTHPHARSYTIHIHAQIGSKLAGHCLISKQCPGYNWQRLSETYSKSIIKASGTLLGDMCVQYINILEYTIHCNTLQHTATLCNTLQHTATYCNILQHTATYCNTLQHMCVQYINILEYTIHVVISMYDLYDAYRDVTLNLLLKPRVPC